jgi:hypothetical protein
MKTVIARMKVYNVDKNINYENVMLHPVYSSDPNSPNYSFSQATPSGQVQMIISNPDAWGFFEMHKEYDITFKRTEHAE